MTVARTAAAPTVLDAARAYTRRGYRVVPIPARSKAPAGIFAVGWQDLRLEEAQLATNFNGAWKNIGIILGEPSGWLIDVDLDCDEAVQLADQHLPPTPLVTGRPSRPRSHRWYIAAGAVTRKFHDPILQEGNKANPRQRLKTMIVEIRSTGAQTVVGPSIHPDGEPYDVLDVEVEPARVEAAVLAAYVEALAEAVVRARHGDVPATGQRGAKDAYVALRDGTVVDPATGEVVEPPANPVRPRPMLAPPTADVMRRAEAYLNAMPPAHSGSGGHSATYAAATAMVHGFGLEPETALRLLADRYNPRCVPPWSDKELAHKVQDAATKPHERPAGWLRDAPGAVGQLAAEDPGVDLSGLLGGRVSPPLAGTRPLPSENGLQVHGSDISAWTSPSSPPPSGPDDPGLLPMEALRVPGFIGEVMDHCLATAPYPNQVLAFCGALALQAFLAGRKVMDREGLRTNLYVLALAHSAAGKEWPRELNARVLQAAGLGNRVAESMASGEGLQDALFVTPSMLFQTDEMDSLLQSINRSKDARHEALMTMLLKMYSSAGSLFPMRRKAGQAESNVIDQPCLVIFGTAIPNHYYAALSERMLTNGLFARMLIFEGGRRGAGQDARPGTLTERVANTAKWWADLRGGDGNMSDTHPRPRVVQHTEGARELLAEQRLLVDQAYKDAEERSDAVSAAVWGRALEQMKKLALIYAVSETPRTPQVSTAAVRWASRIVMHQVRRMLFQAGNHVSESPFDADCLRLLTKLREAPGQSLPHSVLLKRMKMRAKEFREVIDTLIQNGDLEVNTTPRAGSAVVEYALTGGVK